MHMSMESRGEGYSDETLEDISSGSEKVERNKDKEDSKKKKDAEKETESSQGSKKVSFGEARLIANAVNEALVVKTIDIGEGQIRTLKGLLERHGVKLPAKSLEKYTPKEVKEMMIAVHQLLKKATVDAPVGSDYKYTGQEERKREELDVLAIEKSLIEKVKGVDLGLDDFEVEIHKNFEARRGLGAMEGDEILGEDASGGEEEASSEESDSDSETKKPVSYEEYERALISSFEKERQRVKTIISTLMKTDKVNADWETLKTELQGIIDTAKENAGNFRNYRQVNNVATAISDAAGLYSLPSGELKDEFKPIISVEDLRSFTSHKESENLLAQMNKKFLADWRNLKDAQRSALAGDIDQSADLYPGAIQSGWKTMDNAKADIYRKLPDREDPSGLREWRAIEALNGIRTTIEESEKTRVPANPSDIPERLYNVFRKAEAAGLSTEDLGPILNEGLILVRAMPSSTGGERKMREELLRRIESFRAVHVALIQLEKSDMDPNSVIKTFSELWEGKEEVTLEDFLTRYEEDDRGREFYINNEVEEDGEKKTITEKANLFDEEFRLYSEQLRDERIKMNMIEEMTKHSVEKEFSGSTLSEMKKEAGFENLPAEWQAKWESELEVLRQYFVEKMERNKIPLDSWGRKSEIGKTKILIEEWHKKRTLHGAIGMVGSSTEESERLEELAELAAEFGLAFETDKDKKKVKEMFIGKQYLDIRRDRLVDRFKDDLEKRGLKVNKNFSWKSGEKALEAANVDELSDKGYFESLDNTAYRMAWVMMWSNYDNIRIYARDKNSRWHDDYEKVVFHQSTNLFNARATDHLWEFYHKDNENRGRAKDNETNIIWKQFLPGKHHYMFPQNTLMVRWAKNFMSEEQKQILEDRKKEYMDKYDFHNPGLGGNKPEGYEDEFTAWMQSAVVMDMIESGEFSLGAKGFGLTDLAKKKQLKKFEFIDIYGDRAKNHKYANAENFQAYLADPTNAKFAELNSKKEFYSTRSARQFPWMTLAMRAHWEIGNRHYKRIFDKENMQSVQMENVVNTLVASGNVEKEQGVEFKRKNLGFIKISPHGNPENLEDAPNAAKGTQALFFGNSFFRRTRQFFELSRKSSWDYRFAPFGVIGAFFLGLFGDIIKRLPGQTTGSDK